MTEIKCPHCGASKEQLIVYSAWLVFHPHTYNEETKMWEWDIDKNPEYRSWDDVVQDEIKCGKCGKKLCGYNPYTGELIDYTVYPISEDGYGRVFTIESVLEDSVPEVDYQIITVLKKCEKCGDGFTTIDSNDPLCQECENE